MLIIRCSPVDQNQLTVKWMNIRGGAGRGHAFATSNQNKSEPQLSQATYSSLGHTHTDTHTCAYGILAFAKAHKGMLNGDSL